MGGALGYSFTIKYSFVDLCDASGAHILGLGRQDIGHLHLPSSRYQFIPFLKILISLEDPIVELP